MIEFQVTLQGRVLTIMTGTPASNNLLGTNGDRAVDKDSGIIYFYSTTWAASGGGINVVINPTTPYTAANNEVISWDTTAGNKVVNFPAAASSSNFKIVVKKSDSSINKITVDPDGAELVDGSATDEILDQNVSTTYACDGTGWIKI